ncbi:MAG: hypothetical protein ACK5ME_02050 [Parahaliea sp.]
MSTRYSVYFAGDILEGHNPARVRENLCVLFKANEATLNKLFSGSTQLIKRNCDKNTALKYKLALENAGAKPLIKRLGNVQQANTQPTAPIQTPPPVTPKPNMAERVAALAAQTELSERFTNTNIPTVEEINEQEEETKEGLYLCPTGSDLLRPDERHQNTSEDVDTSALSVIPTGERLAQETAPPPPPPLTDHLSMGEVGEDIPGLPRYDVELKPDTSNISLSPEGTDFSDCTGPEAPEPELDLSAIEIAPTGVDMLEQQYRKLDEATTPDVSHLSLNEPDY